MAMHISLAAPLKLGDTNGDQRRLLRRHYGSFIRRRFSHRLMRLSPYEKRSPSPLLSDPASFLGWTYSLLPRLSTFRDSLLVRREWKREHPSRQPSACLPKWFLQHQETHELRLLCHVVRGLFTRFFRIAIYFDFRTLKLSSVILAPVSS
jgi:hypothetical protein